MKHKSLDFLYMWKCCWPFLSVFILCIFSHIIAWLIYCTNTVYLKCIIHFCQVQTRFVLIVTPTVENFAYVVNKLYYQQADTRYTTKTQLVKLNTSHMISRLNLRIFDLKRTKMVHVLNIYYNNRNQNVIELKNKPGMHETVDHFA